jgi:hypothetical protein
VAGVGDLDRRPHPPHQVPGQEPRLHRFETGGRATSGHVQCQ